MISLGSVAPPVDLEDQFGRRFRLADYAGKRAVLLLFYPFDFTPTCSREVPALDALAERFLREANTVVAVVSCDSRFAHAEWGRQLGGIATPMLADCQPRGAVARAYGAWSREAGTSDRATVIVDCRGRVRYAHSVGVGGERDLAGLLAAAAAIARTCPPSRPAPLPAVRPAAAPPGGPPAGVLFVSGGCGHSQHVLRDLANLRVTDLVVRDVDTDPAAARDLVALGTGADGQAVVPLLLLGQKRYAGRGEIEPVLVARYAPPPAV